MGGAGIGGTCATGSATNPGSTGSTGTAACTGGASTAGGGVTGPGGTSATNTLGAATGGTGALLIGSANRIGGGVAWGSSKLGAFEDKIGGRSANKGGGTACGS